MIYAADDGAKHDAGMPVALNLAIEGFQPDESQVEVTLTRGFWMGKM
jgi:hypothetical protein